MRKIIGKITMLFLGALMLPMVSVMSLMGQTAASPPPLQTFSATVYLDYRYYLSQDGPWTLKPTNPATAYLNNQFIFRRAYFTYDNKISDNLKFRFRLDADNTANVTGVSLTGTPPSGTSVTRDDKLRPFIKHLYLEYSNFLIPKMVLNVGMIETLTFKPAEERWGLRSVVKTLVDGYKDITNYEILATSADIGVTLKYSIAKQFRIAGGIYNGAAYTKAENDQYKEIELQAQFIPVAGFTIVGYYDFERKLPVAALPTETKPQTATYKVDAFFEMVKGLVLGAEWFTYKSDLNQVAGEKFDRGGWSVWGRYAVKPDKLRLFARYDTYLPNSLDPGLDKSLVIAGFDWAPYSATWRLQPNVWFASYADGTRYNTGATSNTDIIFNLTFFLSF